ncbi:hypothetical protein C805_02526 [Eubacterium sp. 14-2]|uniref:fructosamine kinase family protein n=1 Tax=Eubacterium sp. 14-2 TaxID=1235790 RepID=UPI00033B9B97|nr:fructosamine kinase family protein [Eubacterium sp. 14-2]EOT24314.1 hypothetical protein C805_02526 [Eubacterium sp. 14-2]
MTDTIQQFSSLDQALHSLFGNNVKITDRKQVAGGDINEAYRLTLSDGMHIFMKSNQGKSVSFFQREAEGLAAIAETGAISTPQVFGCGTGENGGAFLLLEFVESRRPGKDYQEILAQQLARMHQSRTENFVTGGIYGFAQDNYIGANPQVNTPCKSWTEFFRDRRLKPQFLQASDYFGKEEWKKITELLERTGEILTEPEYPSLVHGDLWAGNVMTGRDGLAWLTDPAACVGHREADLAMTELFGGFSGKFYEAYREAAPLQPGYEKRRDFYNLYHLLNHLNLFGRSYLSSVRRIVEEYV